MQLEMRKVELRHARERQNATERHLQDLVIAADLGGGPKQKDRVNRATR